MLLPSIPFVTSSRSAIPHSLYDPSTNPGSEICLFTKDPPTPADYDPKAGVPLVNPIKTSLQATPVAGITKVLSISKLRKNYAQFADRRRLLSGYALFLTDDRILPLMPALLGSKFYEKKKQPVAVNLAQHNIARELTAARDSTYMFLNSGPCCSIRISRSSFSRAQSAENILAALSQIAAHVPKKWEGVQSIHIKTQNSIALPVYNSVASIDQLVPDVEEPKANKKGSEKKMKKRALSTKKETKPTSENGSSKKKQKTSNGETKPVAAAAPVASKAAAATPAKTTGKRQRDDSAPVAAAAAAAPASPAPSAKKSKSAATPAPSAVATTPAKPAATTASQKGAAKSAVKAQATPAPKAASQKKAPATAGSKKK